MSAGRRLSAGITAVGLAVLVSWASRVPVGFSDAEEALLRLSWRQDGITVEACRDRTPEELAALPVHMRNPQACIGDIASYRLVVRLDGRELLNETIRPAGIHGDRPLYVLADVPLPAGSYEAGVTFEALLPDGFETPEGLGPKSWQGRIQLEPGAIALITLDEHTGLLELRES